jgi:hypothetical protein
VWYVSSRTPFNKTLAWEVIALNFAYVALSALVLLTNALQLTTEGSWLVLIAADIVLTLGILQTVGVRRLQ